MSEVLDVVSYNLRGLQSELKRRSAFNHFHEKSHDIILVQETHSTRRNEKIWQAEWGGDIIFSLYNSRARGVAVLFKKGLNYKINNQLSSTNGRYLILEIETNELSFLLINVYAPNEDNPNFFTNLFSEVNKYENPNKLYGGDFNLVLDPLLDKVGVINNPKQNARRVIQQEIQDHDLIDYWRQSNPNTKRYTWMHRKPSFVGSRLDFWLVSSSLTQFCSKTDVPPAFISDHSPITIQIKTSTNERGKGIWKLNNSLLEIPEYVDMINLLIDNTIADHEGEDVRLVWEVIKMKIRGESIKYSSFKKKTQENKKLALEKKLLEVETSINNHHQVFFDEKEKWAQLYKIKDDLQELQENKTCGAMIRSKAMFFEFGEKMSKYYFQLEKHNYINKTIQKIRNQNGVVLTHSQEILRHQKHFFEELYAQKEIELSPLPFTIHKMLTPQQQTNICRPLSILELDNSISCMSPNKTPGPDGISVNFYVKFWSKLRQLLYQVYIKGFEEGELHATEYQGLIVLLPKKK